GGLKLRSRVCGMKHLADRSAPRGQLRARSRDIRDDQVVALSGAGRRRRQLGTELDRARRSGRRELDDAQAVVERDGGDQAPAELLVDPLGAVDVRHGEDADLEPQIDAAHDDLLATFAASAPRLSPSTRLNAGNGWITSARAFSGMPSLIASTSSP